MLSHNHNIMLQYRIVFSFVSTSDYVRLFGKPNLKFDHCAAQKVLDVSL